MNKHLLILNSVLIAVGINSAFAEHQGPGLAQAASKEDVAAWNLNVFPDGEGLPQGEGNVAEGETVYKTKCLVCHGENGLGTAVGDQLAGAQMGLTSDYPEKTIGTYWPYATTIFDVVRRSMPMTAPGSLTNNEVYSVTAYLLYLNNIINEDDVMNAETLPKVQMPNKDGFINVFETEEKGK